MRVVNFSAGPAVLPEEVLAEMQREMLEHGEDGMNVMEMSHRSPMFERIIEGTEQSLRRLMDIPSNYKVLFLQGGASMQFAMVPMNLTRKGAADYIVTGAWAKKAASEAKMYTEVRVVASSADETFSYIPDVTPDMLNKDADYLHITSNNTIYGTRFTKLPDSGNVPVVADMSSNILSEVIDVNRYGLIYAGAQKNIGPAGLTIVIIREDLIGEALAKTPTMLRYSTHAESGSMYNTPPTYGVYAAGKVFAWVERQGGVKAMQEINERKAAVLYDFLDQSALFKGTARKQDRSLMNVPFVLPSDEMNARFLKVAQAAGFVNLKGHRSVGGMRASIYNAMSESNVRALVDFMKKFEKTNG